MKDKTLLILAAGMGSRFGGLKQMTPFGPNGEFIIDYSVFDAIRCGFNKIVFIIKEENLNAFKDTIGKRMQNKLNKENVKVEYVFQNLDNIPEGFNIPEERVKPLGTAHAVLCAKNVINEPFLMINSDDFYGYESFKNAADYIDNNKDESIGLVGYNVTNTLTENGSVKRGICNIKDNKLLSITESSIEQKDGKLLYTPLDTTTTKELDPSSKVSMNMMIFYPSIFNALENRFRDFLSNSNLLKDEFLIPDMVTYKITKEKEPVNMISTNAVWSGVTYKEDTPKVINYIQKLIDEKVYPNNLWK